MLLQNFHDPPNLVIPHVSMSERDFVLQPMWDMKRDLHHPVLNATIQDLYHQLQRQKQTSTAAAPMIRVLPLPRGRSLRFDRTAIIMGIVNVTPDSFSDGGQLYNAVDEALQRALDMESDGADVIDIGGESTRPGAKEVAVEEELQRTIPLIRKLRQASDIAICGTAGSAHYPHAHARNTGNHANVNQIWQCHCRRGRGIARDAQAHGIPKWLQVLDPGIGFAKDMRGNLTLLKELGRLRSLLNGSPLLLGTSRKGFIGRITGEENAEERDFGTVAANVAALCLEQNDNSKDSTAACTILRVHNVRAAKQAASIALRNTN